MLTDEIIFINPQYIAIFTKNLKLMKKDILCYDLSHVVLTTFSTAPNRGIFAIYNMSNISTITNTPAVFGTTKTGHKDIL